MSNDKYLSKPVCTVDVQRDRTDGNTFAVAWSSAGHALPDRPHFLYSQECVQSLQQRVIELQTSNILLRDGMAAIYNTILMDGAQTSLAAIMNAAKQAFEESTFAAARNSSTV